MERFSCHAGYRKEIASLGAGGALNRFHIRRLKTKFGTRTVAPGEIDFEDALAFPIGDLDKGFKIVVELVLNTSRWADALGSAGLLRRAYVKAWTFAQNRRAFGSAIGRYPLVMEALAEMKVDLYAMLASTLRLSSLIERIDLGVATEQERAVHRLLVTINKYQTSIQASLGIRRAQEILGGNGAIEDFSIVSRLYRDAVVFESWEGSHNVLCLQALRDMQRYGLHQALFGYLGAMVDRVTRSETHRLPGRASDDDRAGRGREWSGCWPLLQRISKPMADGLSTSWLR